MNPICSGLEGEVYDLIVSNPPYVTEQAPAALPPEYGHEPALALRAGDDGLDFALRILDEAPATSKPAADRGGWRERARPWRLLPKLPLNWIEFEVGQMRVCDCARDIVKHAKAIRAALAKR